MTAAVLRQSLRWGAAGVVGGLIGSTAAVLLTELIKASLAAASQRSPAWLLGLPLLGLAVSVDASCGSGKASSSRSGESVLPFLDCLPFMACCRLPASG